jgi:hypothetical protein
VANAAALINEGLWRRDKDFQKVSRLAQCTFCQILSQKDLDTAGVLTLHLELLTKACAELTEDQLRCDFEELEQRRFLFVDYDTDEIFIRSYVRRVSVKNQNSWRSVPKNARLVGSEKIRHELAAELRRLRRVDAAELADEIDPLPTPSGPGGNPVWTPSEPGTPSGPCLDGDSSVQVPVLVSPSVGSYVGEDRPQCFKHQENFDGPCIACKKRREWDEAHVADELDMKRAERITRRQAIDNCGFCDENGMRGALHGLKRCDHQAVAQ